MNAIAACALSDPAEAAARPIQMLADLAAHAMRMARLAAEQYEALTTQPAQKPETGKARRQPDPGTLFIRAARLVLDCITKESRLAAGLPLTPIACSRNIPRAASPASDNSPRENFSAEPVRQALRTVTRNHPHGQKLLREGLQHLETALAAAPSQPIEIPELFRRVCEATGIRLDPAQLRKIARDPAFETLAAKPPAPA